MVSVTDWKCPAECEGDTTTNGFIPCDITLGESMKRYPSSFKEPSPNQERRGMLLGPGMADTLCIGMYKLAALGGDW